MKKVRKIISVILVAVMLAGIAAIAPVTADAAVPAWKTAYENYVYKVRQEVDADGGWGWLKDLDGNGIPELFLSLRSFGSTQVISYYNGELKVVAASAYGKVYVQNNMFLLSWGIRHICSISISTMEQRHLPGTTLPWEMVKFS